MMTDDTLTNRLAELIRQLEPPLRRQIVMLRYADGQTYEKIAQELGVSKVTVYNHLSGALQQLRKQLKSKDYE